MPSRRRRRDRRRTDHPEPPRPAPKRAVAKRRAEFEEKMARIRRTRTLVGFLGLLPLLVSLFPYGPFALVPREAFLLVWAAIFGSFIGLTIRMWRERRAFERAASAA